MRFAIVIIVVACLAEISTADPGILKTIKNFILGKDDSKSNPNKYQGYPPMMDPQRNRPQIRIPPPPPPEYRNARARPQAYRQPASNCAPNLLIDDFRSLRQIQKGSSVVNITATKGEYQQTGGVSLHFQRSSGANSPFHLLMKVGSDSHNYFAFQTNQQQCMHLSGYSGIQIVLQTSKNSDATLGIVYSSSGCPASSPSKNEITSILKSRGKLDGQPQSLYVPFTDLTGMAQSSGVEIYLSNITPDSTWRIYSIQFIGSCQSILNVNTVPSDVQTDYLLHYTVPEETTIPDPPKEEKKEENAANTHQVGLNALMLCTLALSLLF